MSVKSFTKYENQWIVTDKMYKKVIVSNEALNELQKEVKKLKLKDSIIMFVPSFDKILVP